MKEFRLIIFVILFANTYLVNSESIFFNHLRGENGLSQVSVNSIYQDEFGIIWVGTRYGLNKYNGNKIELFKHVNGDPNSIFNNNVQVVTGDKKGNIYLKCEMGLVVYDLISQKITTVKESDIITISYGNDNLWVCSNTTIYKYDKSKNQLIEYAHLNIRDIRIFSIRESSTGQLYIGTRNHGLFVMDKNKRLNNLIPNIYVVNFFEDSKQNMCVASQDNGFFIIERSGQILQISKKTTDPNSLPDNFVRSISEDEFGNYWIGTFNGLCRYNPSQNKFTTYKHSETKPYSIGSSTIWCLFKDRQGTIWIGSYYGGIDYFNPEYSFFNFYGVDNGVNKSLSSPLVGKLVEDSKGNLWIGTEGEGLNYLNRKTEEIKIFKSFSQESSGIPKNIKALWIDNATNTLWIGAHIEGLFKMNLSNFQTKAFRYNPSNSTSLRNNYIRDILNYNNKLYLASHNGVLVFDPKTEQCTFLIDNKKYGLENKQIWDMMLDSKARLWFSTAYAVFRYDFKTKILKKYINDPTDKASISATYVNTFFQDSKGRIWIGSAGGGLNLYNDKTDSFRFYNSTNSEIIDDYIVDIKESKTGYLLIATNKGFSFFDADNRKFFNFLNQSVFPITAINDGGLFVTSDGEIYIGSTNGLFSFQENLLNIQPKPFNIVISDIYVNNKLIRPDEDGVLEKSISYLDEISLHHNENAISIEFSCTNFVKALQEESEYQLVGFDNDWIKSNKGHLITYTNLNPGKYTLKIRAKQKGEVCAETSLIIHIQPPFYATWYAYLFYILLVTGIAYTMLRIYTSSIKLKVSLDYEKKEREQIEDLNQSKLRFFTNISHEFRTPLTLIISQIESLLQSTSLQSSLYNRILSVHKNALRMGKLINELLDFRKQEQGFLQIKVSEQNLIKFLNEIVLTFKEYADHRRITFSFKHSEPELKVWFDTNQMEKVIYNLLSNAFKFTPDDGEITVDVVVNGKAVNVIVADNGPGIQPKDMNRIFDRFYQAENNLSQDINSRGTGIGLALAKGIVELHCGTIINENRSEGGSRFIVSLLMNDDHFKPEQKLSGSQLISTYEINYTKPDETFLNEIIESQHLNSGKKYKILVIEDNPEILSMLVQIFTPIYEVHTAVNGKDGLGKTKEIHPDIIVSDVMMPEMSGIEMCSKIKTNLEICHIPVVLLTARTAIEYTIEGLRTGADDYLTKPFETRLLIARCNNLINTRKQLQAKFSRQADAEVNTVATNSLDQKFLTRAIEVVEKTLDKTNFDVNLFAQEMMMGRTAFFQKLKGITGQTPIEFVTNIRLKKSLKMLIEEPEMSITDICYKLGFSSPSYFTKCFREVFGVTPAKYRKDNLPVNEKG